MIWCRSARTTRELTTLRIPLVRKTSFPGPIILRERLFNRPYWVAAKDATYRVIVTAHNQPTVKRREIEKPWLNVGLTNAVQSD